MVLAAVASPPRPLSWSHVRPVQPEKKVRVPHDYPHQSSLCPSCRRTGFVSVPAPASRAEGEGAYSVSRKRRIRGRSPQLVVRIPGGDWSEQCKIERRRGGQAGVRRVAVVATASSTEGEGSSSKFPFFTGPTQKLLTDFAESLDRKLGPYLNDSQTRADVRYFQSADGNAQGSVVLRAGTDDKIDFVCESWLHAVLPFGTLDIGTTVIMVGKETDSPHFLFEFILSGNVLVIVVDHLPRKDLIQDPDYLKRFYEDTELDKVRQIFEGAPGYKPYVSPALFVRSVVSPTSAVFKLSAATTTDPQGERGGKGGRVSSLDEQIDGWVHSGTTQMLDVWFESFTSRGLPVQDTYAMLERDKQIKEKGIEVDLAANLPRIYGPEITSRVVEAFRAGQ